MTIEEQRKAFDAYFKDKYPELHKDVFNEDGDDRAIIGYSFALSAWLASANREGYKLVPVELIKSCNDIAVDCFNKWDIKKEAMPGICELMQDFSYYLQSHDRSL